MNVEELVTQLANYTSDKKFGLVVVQKTDLKITSELLQ